MYRRLDDFIGDWKHESDATLTVLRQLTDASLGQKTTADGRTLGFLAWHIATTIPEMMNRAGLQVDGPEHGPAPASAAEIVAAYANAAASLLAQVESRWTDATLDETREMYGQQWTVGATLSALVKHEAHHRGQVTVLMRQAGLRVPGIYGPAREDWASMGMPAME
jgi:uncharacterized damage-inducible protein DinB